MWTPCPFIRYYLCQGPFCPSRKLHPSAGARKMCHLGSNPIAFIPFSTLLALAQLVSVLLISALLQYYILGASPLGFVEVWKIISQPQIIVQTWIFFLYDRNIIKNKWKFFQLFFTIENWQKKYKKRVSDICYRQDWSQKIIKK